MKDQLASQDRSDGNAVKLRRRFRFQSADAGNQDFLLMLNACFPIPDGDSAQPVTFVTRSARIDLLFTMSDITRAPAKRITRGLIFSRTNFGACGAVWWSQTGSNRRPPACKAGALPTELWPRQECGSRRQVSGQRILSPKSRLSIPGVGGPGKI